jgi:hypothetical protein
MGDALEGIPMSDPILAYETPVMGRPSGLRTATWIALLVLGILHSLVGLYVGGAVGLSLVRPSGMVPHNLVVLILGILGGVLVLFGGSGITYFWASWRIRKWSRAANITAMIVALVNALLFLGVAGVVVPILEGHWYPAAFALWSRGGGQWRGGRDDHSAPARKAPTTGGMLLTP